MAILVDGFQPSALITPMQILPSVAGVMNNSLSVAVNVRVVHLGRERDLELGEYSVTRAHRGRLEGEVGAEDDIDGELAADVGRAVLGLVRTGHTTHGPVELDLPLEEVVAVDLYVDALERLVGEFLEFLMSAWCNVRDVIPSGLAVCCLRRTWWMCGGLCCWLRGRKRRRRECDAVCGAL